MEIAEINKKPAQSGELVDFPRGLRAWHVGYSEHVVTRETLISLARRRVCRTTDNKGRKANRFRESDGAVVPGKVGNATGGKGATSV